MAKKPKKNLKKRHIPMWIIELKSTLNYLDLMREHRPEATFQQARAEWQELDFITDPEGHMKFLQHLKRYYEVEATQQEYEEMIKQLEGSGLL